MCWVSGGVGGVTASGGKLESLGRDSLSTISVGGSICTAFPGFGAGNRQCGRVENVVQFDTCHGDLVG